MQRPIAMVGTREHIFTQGLATPALFMSYQELQFGVVWQRIMYDPLRVRLHYGHPDWMDKVFMMTRGGFAKSSKIVNVSEDVFAGITAALRGGESKQIQYVQVGKGRDIGMLQIAQFEAKVSGGSAVSMTTRDAVRITNNMEFFRMLSYVYCHGKRSRRTRVNPHFAGYGIPGLGTMSAT
jgi:callose synthase